MKGLKLVKEKRRRGFTLAELVIVVTILGVLSGLGFAKLGQVQQTARINADYVAASSLATATSLAIQDGKVKADKDGKIDKELLKSNQYISTIPKPQSINTDSIEFLINIDTKDNIYVYTEDESDNVKVFYPKDQSIK